MASSRPGSNVSQYCPCGTDFRGMKDAKERGSWILILWFYGAAEARKHMA